MIDIYKLESKPIFKKRKYRIENIYHKCIFEILLYSSTLWLIGKVLNYYRIAI